PPPHRAGDVDSPGAPLPPPPPPPEGGRASAPPPPPEGGAPVDLPPDAPRVAITQMWAYAADFKSRNPRAPEMPADLAARLAAGDDDAGEAFDANGLAGRQLAARMPWTDGP